MTCPYRLADASPVRKGEQDGSDETCWGASRGGVRCAGVVRARRRRRSGPGGATDDQARIAARRRRSGARSRCASADSRSAARAAAPARVVVVGAGLAGLTAAYRLKQAGCVAAVHEGSDRVGGRCWTIRGVFADGQIGEHGGELIDQGHTELRQLAQELGLAARQPPPGRAERQRAGLLLRRGAVSGAAGDARPPRRLAEAAQRRLGGELPDALQQLHARGYELDQMSIVDWINESVPGGIDSRLGQLLDIAYNIEYGAESSEQSSLNLLYLLGYSGTGQLPDLRAVEREVPRARRERPGRDAARGRARRARSRSARSSSRSG